MKKKTSKQKVPSQSKTRYSTLDLIPVADNGEYGLGYLMAPEENDLSEAREKGTYHFSHDQLEHQEDSIGR